MIIDGHTHLCFDGSQPIASFENLKKEMALTHTDHVVAFPLSVRFEDNLRLAELARENRFLIPLTFIDPRQPDCVSQLKQCIQEHGMRGLKLHPTLSQFHIDDLSRVSGLMDYCDEHRLPVVVHCATNYPYVHPFRVETLARLYPHVIFQMAHMGAIWAADAAIAVAKRNANVYLDTGIASSNAVRRAINEVPDKVIMGADFPFYMYSIEQEKIRRAFEYSIHHQEPEVLAALMGGNCQRVYGITENE